MVRKLAVDGVGPWLAILVEGLGWPSTPNSKFASGDLEFLEGLRSKLPDRVFASVLQVNMKCLACGQEPAGVGVAEFAVPAGVSVPRYLLLPGSRRQCEQIAAKEARKEEAPEDELDFLADL